MKSGEDMFPMAEETSDDIIELYDEEGKLVKFNIIASLDLDDDQYAILSNIEDEEEIVVFRIFEEDDDFVFESIENEEELKTVVEAYNELLEETDEA